MPEPSIDDGRVPPPLRPTLQALAGASAALARVIRAGGDLSGAAGLFLDALQGCGIRWVFTGAEAGVQALDPDGTYALALDPLNGGGDIDSNMPVGTIFSLYPARDEGPASFLRPAREQIAAGYVIHGARSCLVASFGEGVQAHMLNPDSGRFDLTDARLRLPAHSREYAINAANYRHWPLAIRAYVDDLVSGVDGPRGRDFNMHWTGSLLAGVHRILMRGGICLDPADDRPGRQQGRLRMVQECAPIALLIEQAGGRATDGRAPIMGRVAQDLHARSPLIFGSPENVVRVAAYHDLPDAEAPGLFGHRGLFRV